MARKQMYRITLSPASDRPGFYWCSELRHPKAEAWCALRNGLAPTEYAAYQSAKNAVAEMKSQHKAHLA